MYLQHHISRSVMSDFDVGHNRRERNECSTTYLVPFTTFIIVVFHFCTNVHKHGLPLYLSCCNRTKWCKWPFCYSGSLILGGWFTDLMQENLLYIYKLDRKYKCTCNTRQKRIIYIKWYFHIYFVSDIVVLCFCCNCTF